MKKIIKILKNLVYYNFLIDGRINFSNLDINATIFNTARYLREVFNINADKTIELFINDQIYNENDTLLLASLGYDPKINIIEIEKHVRISNDSGIYECTLDKNQDYTEIIRFNLFSINKVSIIFNIIIKKYKMLKEVLMRTLYYREERADNSYEQGFVQKILMEIEELSDTYLAKISSKLNKIL